MDPLLEALRTLRARFEDHARALAEEVSAYPGPIARCDDQLPGLIARRTEAYAALRAVEALDRERASLGEAEWRARATALLARWAVP
jgi:hypothetical protein